MYNLSKKILFCIMLLDRGELWYIFEKRWYKSCFCDYKVNFNDKGLVFGMMGVVGGGVSVGYDGCSGRGVLRVIYGIFFVIYKLNI